jgi:2-polyprenyl-3-methyl-5-hydroxy-6-metoxy-1,4-benzoquinol methylase
MIDWREYWTRFPEEFADDDFRRQVGRTAKGGIPTPAPELETVVDEVASCLSLEPRDRLLDLCCGNGLLTTRFAERCREVVGVDFSEPMIRVARTYHTRPNVEYVEGSVLRLDQIVDGVFDKVCMIESLAYFRSEELALILRGTATHSTPHARVLFSGVLDEEAKWSFFNTPERRAIYERQQTEGNEVMGRWWTRAEIGRIAAEQSYETEFLPQNNALNTAHYRFNVVMKRARHDV